MTQSNLVYCRSRLISGISLRAFGHQQPSCFVSPHLLADLSSACLAEPNAVSIFPGPPFLWNTPKTTAVILAVLSYLNLARAATSCSEAGSPCVILATTFPGILKRVYLSTDGRILSKMRFIVLAEYSQQAHQPPGKKVHQQWSFAGQHTHLASR